MTSKLSPRVSLRGTQSGVQYAGWTPRSFALQGLGNRVLPDQRIPVGDGVSLSADVYTPEAAGRYPAVVSFAAYSYERHAAGIPAGNNEAGSPPVFTDRGYCPVVVERRGMGRSGGEQNMFFSEADVQDHMAAIAWAAEQPWCNGEVVLFGTSYYGMTQPLVAVERPPALKAFFANEICTDYYRHLIRFGGVPALYFLNIWMGANFTQEQYDLRMSPTKRALLSHVTNGPAHSLIEKAVHHRVHHMFEKFMSATPVEDIRRVYADWLLDSKTRATTTAPEGPDQILDRIDVPFVTVQNLGYFNLHQFGSYELFEKASTPADKKWLILGAPTYELPVFGWQGEALAFFDHVLRGTDNGYAEQEPVRYWSDGADRFETATAFPPPRAERTRLYLGSAGGDHETHPLTPRVPADGANSWAAVPIGLPVLGGFDKVAPQTLAFEFTADRDLRLAGAVTANLRYSCNEIDSYVIARVCRVGAGGELHHLSMGAIRPVSRDIDATRGSCVEIAISTDTPAPLVPGEPVELRFSLTPGPVFLRAGEKLRVDLGSRSDLLRETLEHGYAQFDLPVPPYFARNTVHFGGASWIEVDMLPEA